MPIIKAQGLVVSDQMISLGFPYISICKKCEPQGHFWQQGHYLNKLCRGPHGDAKCQITMVYVFVVSVKKLFKVFILKPILSPCDLDLQ